MVIIEKTSAIKALNKFASEDWDKVGGLMKLILNNDLEAKFDEIATYEFPNGCEIEEFQEWCETEAEKQLEKFVLNFP